VSKIPRSLLVCEGNVGGNNGSSWIVLAFVLGPTQFAYEFGADEDQIPPNGNLHLENAHFLNENQNQQFPGFFEDVGDLAKVQ